MHIPHKVLCKINNKSLCGVSSLSIFKNKKLLLVSRQFEQDLPSLIVMFSATTQSMISFHI